MGEPVKEENPGEIVSENIRYNDLPGYLKAIFVALTLGGLMLAMAHFFSIRVRGSVMYIVTYYYLFAAIFLSCFFIIKPARKKDINRIPWYDLLASVLSLVIGIYFAANGWEIGEYGWRNPNAFNTALALIYCLLILEAGRRMAGPVYLIVCLITGFYPLVADHMPGVLGGIGYTPVEALARNIFSPDGMLGIPLRIPCNILISFLLFAGVLMASGAGKFFLDLAMAILGRFRGGPAKVSVVASGFFGSLSGDLFSNIVGTGSITIPAMKKLGYSPRYAGAIEACASAGGGFMPPIMGPVAFVMATFLGVDYSVIILSAALPAILYYFGLLMQVDAYAANTNIKGLPKEEIPSLKLTIKEGWHFIFVLAFLVWGLVYMKWSIKAPIYATGLLFLFSFKSSKTMMTPRRIFNTLATVGNLAAQGIGIMLPLIFLLAGLVSTGVSGSLVSLIIASGGGNILITLLGGVIICYLLGMVGMVIVPYIFLAVSMAPAVIDTAGLNPIAVHLFIIFYSQLGAITPPVAPAAFLASTLSGANPMKTAFLTMRLGIVIYFIPFFFVFDPSLILQGPVLKSVYLFAFCLIGTSFIAGGLGGYLLGMGRVDFWQRPVLVVAGLLTAFPEWKTTFIGLALAVLVIAAMRFKKANEIAIA